MGYIEATVRIPPIRNYVLNASSIPIIWRVPVQFEVSTVLHRAMAKITIERACTHASDMWQQTYMSTVVTDGVAGTVEMKNDDIPSVNAPLVTTKPIVIPPLGCK